MSLIGYARVSTSDQTPLPQREELTTAGCVIIHEEQASGGNWERPVLSHALTTIQPGQTLVVVRIDRLARSLSHLLQIIEQLTAKKAHFRSLRDPIDTASPQGKFSLQVLGAAAEFERALLRERVTAGLASAKEQGRIGGNPGVRMQDPDTLQALKQARENRYFARLNETAPDWVPKIRRLRPTLPWEDVLRVINSSLPAARRWTHGRLLRAVRCYVRNGLLEATVLDRAPRQRTDNRQTVLVAALRNTDPTLTLQALGERLEALRERTPRGQTRWHPSSVKMLLGRAGRLGLLHVPSEDDTKGKSEQS